MAYKSNFFGTPQLPESNKFVEITNDSRFPPVSVIKWDYRDSGYSLSSVDIFSKYAVVTYLANPDDIKISLSAENINVNLQDVENILNVISPDVTTIKNNTDAVESTLTTISNNIGTTNTNVGTINTNVADIETLLTRTNALVNSVSANVADVGTINTTVGTINTAVGTINTNIADIETNTNDIEVLLLRSNTLLNNLTAKDTLTDTQLRATGVPVSGTFWPATQPVSGPLTDTQLRAIVVSVSGMITNTVAISTVQTLPVSGTVNTYPAQGTSVSNTNFTSVTPSTELVAAVAGREVLTVFNEGPGNLHISPGATCTTVAYQVRLAAGDYWECPAGQLSLVHSAVFATAGTARVTQVT
jgi:hypothetical protein